MRIRTKLTLLLLSLAIIPLVIVANIFFFNAQKDLMEEIYERLSAISTLKKDRLEMYFVSKKEDMKAVQGFLDIKINLPTLEQFDKDRYNFAYLKALGRLNDQISAFMRSHQYADIMLLDRKGKVVFNANPMNIKRFQDRNPFNAEVLIKALKDGYISDPVLTGDKSSAYNVFMVSGVNDIQGLFSGYVVLVIDMNAVYDFISSNTGVGNTGETLLLKRMPNNKFLFISPLAHAAQFNTKKEMTLQIDSKISESIDYRGKKVLAVWQNLPSLGWVLMTKIDKEEGFASVTRMRNLFFSILLIVLFVIVLSSLAFAGSIADPVHQLQRGVAIIGKGNLDYKVSMPTHDEIGELSREFDEMVDNLKKTMVSRDELRTMSFHDPLTGVLNRRGLQDVLFKTVTMSQRMGINVQVLLLDLDNFKGINDRYGHGVGDSILTGVAESIKQTVRVSDYVARIGGDEFMVILLDSREAEALMVADKIRMAIAQLFVEVNAGEIVRTTCSMGIMPLGDKPISIDELLQQLHLSLHLSKQEGKNRITYQGAQGKIEASSQDVSAELKKVLVAGDKFFTVAQPIFALRSMSIVGYELLSRLDYEGYTAPDAFLLFARNNDLLSIVDYACLRASLKALKTDPIIKTVHMNIFPSTLAEIPVDRLIEEFSALKDKYHFCLEINEQQILGDPSYLIPPVQKLKEAGIRIALDDYGFGRSSVETLILLEPDIVKIDKKIINDISKDTRKLNNLKRLLKIIESCKASVIAEGIETQADLDVLSSLGVPAGQGFLMGKPEKSSALI